MTEVLQSDTVELIKHVVDRHFREVQERTEIYVKDQVNRVIVEQMNMYIEQLIHSRADLIVRLYEVMRDAHVRSGLDGRASGESGVDARLEAVMGRHMEQMKLHVDERADVIYREALQALQAMLNQQLDVNTEALKQHFEQRYQDNLERMRSEIGRSETSLTRTVEARVQTLGEQLREEFRVANALMRQYVSEQFMHFCRQLQGDFQTLTRVLEDRFVFLTSELREVFQHELSNMRRALQEEFEIMRQELKAEFAVMKNELKAELREEMRQHALATRAFFEDVVQRIQLQMAR